MIEMSISYLLEWRPSGCHFAVCNKTDCKSAPDRRLPNTYGWQNMSETQKEIINEKVDTLNAGDKECN